MRIPRRFERPNTDPMSGISEVRSIARSNSSKNDGEEDARLARHFPFSTRAVSVFA